LRRRQSSTRDANGPGDAGSRGPRPRKRFGQNFLVDPSAVSRIVAALAPTPGETVLEIGPGRGALTEALLAAVPALFAIEIDRDLAARLAAAYPEARLRLIVGDVLDVPWAPLAADGPLVIAGNLPYNISKPVAMKMVEERRVIARAVLMFQREVAQRLTAAPGSKAYGPLTVLAGLAYRIEPLFDLKPGAFLPAPQVSSTVTRWTARGDVLPEPLVVPLRAVLAAAFAHRRQTLHKNLRAAFAGSDARARELVAAAGLDGSLRAETIPPAGFVALAHGWPA